jgi:hypothetical protein
MSRPAPVTPSGHEADPAGKRLRELLVPDRCAVLVQELQEGVVGPISRLTALTEVVHESSLLLYAARVLGVARRVGVPVIHCTAENLPQGLGRNTNARLFVAARKLAMENHPGSESVRPVSDLGPFDTDIALPRFHGLSPLTGSALDSLLRNSGVRARCDGCLPECCDTEPRLRRRESVVSSGSGVRCRCRRPTRVRSTDDGVHPVSCLHDRVERRDRRCVGLNRRAGSVRSQWTEPSVDRERPVSSGCRTISGRGR